LGACGTFGKTLSEESFTTRRDYLLVGLISAAVSIVALVFYYRQNAILLYGDAVAHINIARRVFDSQRPGPSQLGTVWLPLPHILILPFVISNWAWRTGLGASIPSMIAYVAGVLGVFRLLFANLKYIGASSGTARAAAWVGAIAFGANPNLIYMQATAMGESIYLAFFVWAVIFFADFVRKLRDGEPGSASLRWCAVMLLGCMLCRYDGWFLAACFGVAALFVLAKHEIGASGRPQLNQIMRSGLLGFILIVAVAPVFWLAWNQIYFGNALEWMNGPYSARAIMQRSIAQGQPPHPGYHDIKTAAVYYTKCAKLNLSGQNLGWGGARYGWPRRIENAWPAIAIAATVLLLLFARSLWPLLLLWIPLPFYALAIAYGGVPIFMPVWWPYSFYNVRYGLNMVPLVAVAVGLTVGLLAILVRLRAFTAAMTVLALVFVGASYGMIWKSGPVCLHEAAANSEVRIGLEQEAGAWLRSLPPGSKFLMQTGYYVGVLERAGIPLKRTINETDFKLWEAALANPAAHVDYLVAAGNDRVAVVARMHTGQFEPVATFQAKGQPTIVVYKRK
jgi:hypothetical protein